MLLKSQLLWSITAMTQKQVYINRRHNLMNLIGNGLAIIPTNDELIRNQDTTYQYRFDSNFYYLTGFTEPESVLVMDGQTKKSILFCRDKNLEREIWDGFRYGVEGAKGEFGFDEAYNIEDFATKITDLMAKSSSMCYTLGAMPNYDKLIINSLSYLHKLFRRGVEAPTNIIDINSIIAGMRVIKDEHDIALMTRTCEISSMAHIAAMKFIKQAKYEHEVEAKILEVFYQHGARYPAYTPIVATGKNACVLHYVANNARIEPNQLILIDAGCEYHGYAGDITRTYPVNGKFTKPQQAIYEIVLEANKRAIEKVKPGNYLNEPGDIAIKILTQGLIDLKLLKGSLEENIANDSYKQFYMHGIGHWLGLDVHDVGAYKINGNWRTFEAGMCTTIEPGLYIRPADNVPSEYWNIGVRIEDDILLTKDGRLNLTDSVPKEIIQLEQIING